MPDEGAVADQVQQEFMDDLDFVPEVDDDTSGEDEGGEPEPKPAKEPEPQPEPQPEPKPKEGTEPEPKPEPTEAELLKVYKEQLSHFQKLYEEEKSKPRETVKPVETAPEPARTVPTQDQLRTHYTPEVKKTVENGYMSEEFANSFPDEAVQMLYHRDIIYNLVKRVSEVVTLLNQEQGKSQASTMDAKFETLFDGASKQGDFYSPLAEKEVQEKFKGYLLELNPFVDQINEEFISQQWLAFNKEAILAAAKIAAGGGDPGPNRGNARGEGSGNRPGKGKSSTPTVRPWDDI